MHPSTPGLTPYNTYSVQIQTFCQLTKYPISTCLSIALLTQHVGPTAWLWMSSTLIHLCCKHEAII